MLTLYKASFLASTLREPLNKFNRFTNKIKGKYNCLKSQDKFKNYNLELLYGLKANPIKQQLDN